MFKAIIGFVESTFTKADKAISLGDVALDVAHIHADGWLKEAVAEAKERDKELGITNEEVDDYLANLRVNRKRR